MEAKAIAKFQRVSPRKTRLVAKNVQGKGVEEALNILRFTPNKPAGVIYGVLKSAVANAEYKGLNTDDMVIRTISASRGRVTPGHMARAHGRATEWNQDTVNLEVIIEEVE